MDVLSDILDTIELRGTLYFRTRFAPPFAIAVPVFKQAVRFHLVVQGRLHVSTASAVAELGPGELILIPKGGAHILADRADREPMALDRVIEESGYDGKGVFVWGGGSTAAGDETQLVCGHFTFAEGVEHPLLRSLPDLLRITTISRARHPLLDDALQLVIRASYGDRAGADASLRRLSEVVFIEALRAAGDDSVEISRLLAAMADPRIGKALALIHQTPDRPWSIAGLAAEVAMSRSRFAERFQEVIGMAPMSYLAEWRLLRARALVAQSQDPIQVIARKSGFASAAGFSRAFAARFGVSPRAARHTPEE
jgi:AraC family transcriptional regulator, activator of mtrCDE